MLSRCTGGRMQDGFCSICGEIFYVSHQSWYTGAPVQDKDQVGTWWPWPYFQSRRSFKASAYKRWFPLVSDEIFDVSSPNLVNRSTRARWRPSSNWVTLTFFHRHRGYLGQRHLKDGFHSISEQIFDVSSPNLVSNSTRAWQRPSLNLMTLTLYSSLAVMMVILGHLK